MTTKACELAKCHTHFGWYVLLDSYIHAYSFKISRHQGKNYLHTLILKYFSFDFAWNDRLFFLGHQARKAWHFSFFIMGKNIFQKWHFYNFAVFLYKTKCEDKVEPDQHLAHCTWIFCWILCSRCKFCYNARCVSVFLYQKQFNEFKKSLPGVGFK